MNVQVSQKWIFTCLASQSTRLEESLGGPAAKSSSSLPSLCFTYNTVSKQGHYHIYYDIKRHIWDRFETGTKKAQESAALLVASANISIVTSTQQQFKTDF